MKEWLTLVDDVTEEDNEKLPVESVGETDSESEGDCEYDLLTVSEVVSECETENEPDLEPVGDNDQLHDWEGERE